MKHITHPLYTTLHDITAPWRKIPLEWVSALICLVVLHAISVSLFSETVPHINGTYLALACVGCIIALLATFFTDTNIRKAQSAGLMLANLMAIFCFY